MLNARKSLKKPRTIAFFHQNGCCFYCKQPMWTKDQHEFLLKYKVTHGQSKLLECTGEHLVAHGEGGASDKSNIVAACRFCNQHRHRCKVENTRSPRQFAMYVQKRMTQGRWHGLRLVS